MGLFGEIRREFIARPDQAKGQILYKWPDTNIRKLTQLTVEQDELAVFFRDGRVQGTVMPGRSTLDSSEIPFLGMLVDAASGGNLFKTEIYFVSTREFPNLPFGGMIDNVVDPETTLAIGLRVFGEYSLKVVEPQSLILNLVGTQNIQTNDQVTDWMREQMLKVLRTDVVTHVVSQNWPILGIAAHTEEIEQETLQKVQSYVASYGLQIMRLGNFTISIKEDDEETLKRYRKDAQYSRLAGGFQQYSVGEALQGVGEGAAQGGGGSNPAVLGIGLGLGGMVTGAGQTVAAGGQVQVRCGKCGTLNSENAKFCSNCGQTLAPAPAPAGAVVACPSCGTQNASTAKFCSNCGASMQAPTAVNCPQCGTESTPGTKFCPNCGNNLAAPPSQPPSSTPPAS
ncbi:SPFH domain-containing protein [Candidatus Nephthysia bennettiae]|uniref:SPFH domain-containing protein n=1 Tax=Candidatus Nephthysia bennettiae TaxID=3127016 RepID=A0A934JZU2_9BACT|nr:SPFH domain-containing protein [Candidatus Dormibacteraeota bacterium]MBJ7612177.1 SPFH domain-containing protein [Candidatus Dormibacteraeota bacterium]